MFIMAFPFGFSIVRGEPVGRLAHRQKMAFCESLDIRITQKVLVLRIMPGKFYKESLPSPDTNSGPIRSLCVMQDTIRFCRLPSN